MDCRYLISNLKPDCKILSLTTVATPHRGSPFADYCMAKIGKARTFPPSYSTGYSYG